MSEVLYERRDALGLLTLNRPDKLNAISAAMLDQLGDALDEAERDDRVRVLLLAGNGRAFSAGFDLDMGEPPAGDSKDAFIRRELRRDFDAIMRFWSFPKPSIAAVHGYCLGSAMEIAAVCDMTVSGESCRFGAPEVRFGSGIVCLILPWIVGQKHARELLLTGSDRIDARRAADIGLVNRVVADDRVLDAAAELASEVAGNDPLAVRLTKSALNRSLEIAGLWQALEQALAIDVEIETTETGESREFNRILAAEGPGAAIAWRRSHMSRDGGVE